MSAPNPPFAHLSVRSVHSLREGAIRLDELAARTRALGMTSVALTDRDTLGGAVRFAQACGRYGVRPVFGVRLTVASASESPGARRPGAFVEDGARARAVHTHSIDGQVPGPHRGPGTVARR